MAAGVLAAATAVLFVNPAFAGTVDYYRGVFGNEARRMGVGLWKPLELGGIDLLLIVAALVLLGLRGRRPPQRSPLGGGGDRRARRRARSASRATGRGCSSSRPIPLRGRSGSAPRRLACSGSRPLVFAGAALVLVARGPADPGSHSLAERAARLGRPVLASAVLGQQVQVAGGPVWVDNPIDAFRRADQRLYLLWVDGKPGGAAAIAHAGYVLVVARLVRRAVSPRTTRGSRLVATTARAALYRVGRAVKDERGAKAPLSSPRQVASTRRFQ